MTLTKSNYIPYTSVLLNINKNVQPYGPEGNVEFPFQNDLTWVYGAAIGIAFIVAMGIGANDVANSFATSVGSKSLSLLQALIVAGIFEFSGAIFLGASVTDMVKSGLVDPIDFAENERPDLMMIGMFCALISVAFWLFMATAFEMPVSTTHSTVGAILGFGLCISWAPISWNEILKIIGSWFLSPILSGIFSSSFYMILKKFILNNENSFERTLIAFPIIVWFTVTINLFFILIKGGKSFKIDQRVGGAGYVLLISIGCAILPAALIHFLLVPRMRSHLKENMLDPEEIDIEKISSDVQNGDENRKVNSVSSKNTDEEQNDTKKKKKWGEEKIHGDEHKNDRIKEIHQNSENYDLRTEKAFGYIQVFTACMMSFAHGANDVANAIGPLASIVEIYNTNGYNVVSLLTEGGSSKSEVPVWILALGGGGLVVGLALFGYKILRALGVKLIKISASRGSCIELATAFVIVTGTILKLPLSTTHTMVGASIAVGIVDGVSQNGKKGFKSAINGKLLIKILSGWVLTLVVAAAVSALVFSIIVYAPSMETPLSYQNALNEYGRQYQDNMTIDAGSTLLVGFSNGKIDPLN